MHLSNQVQSSFDLLNLIKNYSEYQILQPIIKNTTITFNRLDTYNLIESNGQT